MARSGPDGFDASFLNVAKSTSLWGSLSSHEALKSYFQTELPYRCGRLYSKLAQALADDNPFGPRVVTTTKETTHALSQIHFVYLDVGCWTGNGDDPTDAKKKGWPRHREFGIVYRSLVLLCAYARRDGLRIYTRYCNPSVWTADTTRLVRSETVDDTLCDHPFWNPVGDLLKALAAIDGSALYVLGATAVMSPYMPVPEIGRSSPISVFLGDIHAPVATSHDNAHVLENGHEMLLGRLDVDAHVPSWLPALVPGPAGDLAKAVDDLATVLTPLEWTKTATPATIDRWLSLYHADGQQTADIFQDAGADLSAFTDALADFHQETFPLHLVQLGDLFDLWIGFQPAFGKRQGDAPVIDVPLEQTMDFARYWVDRTLFASGQGSHLVHLLTLSERAGRNKQTRLPFKTTFLHGNHDNYLKHGNSTPIIVPNGLHAGKRLAPFHLPSFMQSMPGLWAEHGHQWDDFNHDDDPWKGHALTQGVFLHSIIRDFEKLAGWAFAFGDGNRVQRIIAIQRAMSLCLLNHIGTAVYKDDILDAPYAPCRGIYVMGHTHEALLKRVELLP